MYKKREKGLIEGEHMRSVSANMSKEINDDHKERVVNNQVNPESGWVDTIGDEYRRSIPSDALTKLKKEYKEKAGKELGANTPEHGLKKEILKSGSLDDPRGERWKPERESRKEWPARENS